MQFNPGVAGRAYLWWTALRASNHVAFSTLPCICSRFAIAVASRSGEQWWYSSRIVRSVGFVVGFAEHPNKLFNPARFARWTPNRYALGCRLA